MILFFENPTTCCGVFWGLLIEADFLVINTIWIRAIEDISSKSYQLVERLTGPTFDSVEWKVSWQSVCKKTRQGAIEVCRPVDSDAVNLRITTAKLASKVAGRFFLRISMTVRLPSGLLKDCWSSAAKAHTGQRLAWKRLFQYHVDCDKLPREERMSFIQRHGKFSSLGHGQLLLIIGNSPPAFSPNSTI